MHDHEQGRSFHRLRKALFSATPDQRNAQFHRTKAGENDDGDPRLEFLEFREKIKSGAAGEPEIENCDIGPR